MTYVKFFTLMLLVVTAVADVSPAAEAAKEADDTSSLPAARCESPVGKVSRGVPAFPQSPRNARPNRRTTATPGMRELLVVRARRAAAASSVDAGYESDDSFKAPRIKRLSASGGAASGGGASGAGVGRLLVFEDTPDDIADTLAESTLRADEKNETILHHAARVGDIDALVRGLAEGAPINHKNIKGQTALFVAVESAMIDAAVFLIKAGADTLATDSSSRSFVDYCRAAGRMDLLGVTPDKKAAAAGDLSTPASRYTVYADYSKKRPRAGKKSGRSLRQRTARAQGALAAVAEGDEDADGDDEE